MDKVDLVKIIECPRDAWQGLPGLIPAADKAAYLQKLMDAGFRHIDATSFVSPSAVPQMADSEEVLQVLKPPVGTEIIGIVANVRGAERAIATGAVQTLGFPYSVSATFLERNQRQTQNEALRTLAAVADLAFSNGLDIVAYISMAFGNPYGDAWNTALVREACAQLTDLGVKTISLADTVGAGNAETITNIVAAMLASHKEIELGVHLHARSAGASALIRAAYEAGCRRFDSALGGFGGCPFAQDELVGNIPTETLVQVLTHEGAELPSLGPLNELVRMGREVARSPLRVAQ